MRARSLDCMVVNEMAERAGCKVASKEDPRFD